MKLEDFARIINKTLDIHFVPKRNPEWYCTFQRGDVKEGAMLCGIFGNGNSPNEALRAYAKKIKGTKMIFNAGSKDYRQEYEIPEDIE